MLMLVNPDTKKTNGEKIGKMIFGETTFEAFKKITQTQLFSSSFSNYLFAKIYNKLVPNANGLLC